MNAFKPINARSYYDYLPPMHHACGDIWINLPSMGLLSAHEKIVGIIITPACDVSKFKAETLTYLPVLSIRAYLGTIAFLPIIRREIIERYKSAKVDFLIEWPEKGYASPSDEAITLELKRLSDLLNQPNRLAESKKHIERAVAGLKIASVCRSSCKTLVDIQDYALLFGKQWENIKRDIVRNSYRSDIHFLPADGEDSKEFGISEHSVVLFRYPISVPSELLTEAQRLPASAWSQYINLCSSTYSASVHFKNAMPTKILSLRGEFLSDLLTRFTGLFGRIGSPDFSSIAIDKYIGEIV